MRNRLSFFPIAAALLLAAQSSQAQDGVVRLMNPDVRAVEAYWTPERLKAAQPLSLPPAAPARAIAQNQAPVRDPNAKSGEGRAPILKELPSERHLFAPSPAPAQLVATPHASDNDGFASYTSSRVFPMFSFWATPYSADRAYPYITVGKLFFTANGRPAFCSASVIQHRIVVTAAHCVHTGFRTGHFYSNWMFVPAYRDGTAPLGVWNWTALAVTTTWLNEGAQPYSSADYAMFAFADQPVNGTLRSLGDVTGWLGWQTLSLHANHTTKLGYACNLDYCDKMQQITSMGIADIVEQNVLAGGDARSGFDGSPWIQNFQVLQVGGGTGTNSGSNRVVGVTSHITEPNPYNQQTLSSSTPDGRWITLLNTMCGIHAGNCL